jgi:hypothetical protein
VTPSPTVRLRAYPAICAALLLAAVGLHRPELVAVAAPFGLIAAVGLARSVPPDVTARMAPTELRAIEGDGVTALVEIDSPRAQWQVDVELAVPGGLASVGGPPRRALRPAPGTSVVPFDLACGRWGGFVVPGRIRVREPLGLRVWDAPIETPLQVRVHPQNEAFGRRRRCISFAPSYSATMASPSSRRTRASSSPTCGPTSPATGCDASTGG